MTVPAVSLMVPAFNRVDLIGASIESALGQTFADLEVVVVDGASTDGTWELIQRYAASDPRVRAIREATNSGPVGGWTRCLAEARGTYATFLWSDDLLMPTFLERTVPLLADNAVGFAVTAAQVGAEPGSGTIRYRHPTRRMASGVYIEAALEADDRFPVSPACALFRLDDLRTSLTASIPTTPSVDLSSTGAGTDVLFYLRTAERYREVACVSDALAFFRAHGGSITLQGRAGRVQHHYAVARAWFAGGRRRGRLRSDILARHWLRDMRTRRRLVDPRTAARAYCGLISPTRLLIAGGRVAAREFRKRLPA